MKKLIVVSRDRGVGGERLRHRRGREVGQEVGDRRHLRAAAGPEVVGSLGDAGPAGLVAAFKKAGVSYVITNANGDPQKQKTQADQCLANGAKVVILDLARQGLLDRDRGRRDGHATRR